jgi:hypothetical protein
MVLAVLAAWLVASFAGALFIGVMVSGGRRPAPAEQLVDVDLAQFATAAA